MLIQLTSLQARVIGALLEKEITTPDQYPLSLNALTLACNQKSNRDPVMQLSESDVQNTLDELREKNMLFEHTGTGSRVVKYKHRFCNTEFNSLKFNQQEVAIICVLLLRGPQTPGELRTRTNRLAEFSGVNEVEACLQDLANHDGDEIVVKLPREPGKREARYAHLFSGKPTALEQGKENTQSETSAFTSDSHLSQNDGSKENLAQETLSSALKRIDELELIIENLSKQVADMQETLDILSS